ncbi:MAG TPA: response regulator [Cyclobacteriaceae bacterium]|nr:response regulator [Cyclobacteriaceae bacterium]
MIKLVIVEDEPIIAADLRMILEQHAYEVIAAFDNAEEALPYLLTHKPDLVLLDIALSGRMTGIALAETLFIRSDVPFIFITSYVDKATIERVQKLDPAAYIVKPFQPKNLIANIELALSKRLKSGNLQSMLRVSDTDQVFVKKNNELFALKPTEITHIEAFDNYAYVYTLAEKFLLSHTLKSIEEKLTGMGFIRVHKSFLINVAQITSIQEGYLFINEIKIPIGKSYKAELMKTIKVL